jgi:hypothetical protein
MGWAPRIALVVRVLIHLARWPRRPARIYGGLMTEEDGDASEPDVMSIYDTGTDAGLVCRVCGSLVASTGEYPRAHWDWHEAPNGA